jgi:Flp pilus assembly protein TadG
MFPENQTVQSFRGRRTHLKQQLAERFAFGWRSAFNVCVRTKILAKRWTKASRFQPRSGVRAQLTAQAVGKSGNRQAPEGRKISSHAHSFSAAIYALKSATALVADVIKANFSEFPRILANQRNKNNASQNDNVVASTHSRRGFCLLRQTDAAALIEFAVALPLLVVLVVGIFDFGGAFNLKQKLNNAVREGARFGASQPTNDLALFKPPSVDAIRFLVDSYLQTAKINDCGLSTAPQPVNGGGFTWVYTVTGGGCTLTLTINRGSSVQTSATPPVNMLLTRVHISYPYQWHFNNVIKLLVPGANYALGNIQSDAAAFNMN